MKIKREHLEQLMKYMEDELPEDLFVSVEDNGFSLSFSFDDKEERNCKIVIYESTLGAKNPRLVKDMELKTRLPKKTDGEK